MRADAPMFSPTPSTTTWTTPNANGGELAVTHYADESSGYAIADQKYSPRELIVHESISHLIHQVQELYSRCEGLEATNTELKKYTESLNAAFEAQAVQNSVVAPAPMPVMPADLTGYASSDTSSRNKPGSQTGIDQINQHLDLVMKILEEYKTRIETQAGHLADLVKGFERHRHDQTHLKGRVGALEKKFRSFEEEVDLKMMDAKSILSLSKSGKSGTELDKYFADEIEQAQFRITQLELSRDETSREVNERLEVLATAIQGDEKIVPRLGIAKSSGGNSAEMLKLESDINKLKTRVRDLTAKASQQQKIDDAPTRDALHLMYHQLDQAMDGDRRCNNLFEGTVDELFTLRDRVVSRLAIFDLYGQALAEAKSANVDL